MLRSVDAALEALAAEEEPMSPQRLFEGFDPREHEQEARERWGETTQYAEAMRRTRAYGKRDWSRMRSEGDAIVDELAAAMQAGAPAQSAAARELAERHRLHIDRWFYPCGRRMHAALAGMYLTDPRFRQAFDRHTDGLAEYVAAAIRANAARSGDPD
jgi:hypothetical protein